MAESDNDIEFLDEDAVIVQQCVQGVQYTPSLPIYEESAPLLIERQPADKRGKKRKVVKIAEDDSDYDPSQDYAPPSPQPSHKVKKKKQPIVNKKVKTLPQKEVIAKLQNNPNLIAKKVQYYPVKDRPIDRNKCNIRIPDYEDPLCLPVKAIKLEASDVKRLNNWNNVCLEHFKQCDNILKPERGETNSSTRTVVFRNVVNKQTGQSDTTIWSKTCVENDDGDRKSEIFQCVLPRYREKKVPRAHGLLNRKLRPYHIVDEVLLSKEMHKDGEVLVAYKPRATTSAVYKLVSATDDQKQPKEEDDKDEYEIKKYMKELVCCKMCAPCFQTSWRGVNKSDKKTSTACPICGRATFVTTYNLLSHFKTHSAQDMRKYKSVISNILAETVEYHYKCRICREQFSSIKRLRSHIKTHQGIESFFCEVGNHIAN